MDDVLFEIAEILRQAGRSMAAKAGLIFASLAGGFIALRYERRVLNWWQSFIVLLGGTGCAYYITPVLVEYFEFTAKMEPSFGFLIGLTSMRTLEVFYKLAELAQKNPKEFFETIATLLPTNFLNRIFKKK